MQNVLHSEAALIGKAVQSGSHAPSRVVGASWITGGYPGRKSGEAERPLRIDSVLLARRLRLPRLQHKPPRDRSKNSPRAPRRRQARHTYVSHNLARPHPQLTVRLAQYTQPFMRPSVSCPPYSIHRSRKAHSTWVSHTALTGVRHSLSTAPRGTPPLHRLGESSHSLSMASRHSRSRRAGSAARLEGSSLVQPRATFATIVLLAFAAAAASASSPGMKNRG